MDMKSFHERELHPFLNYYLNKTLGIAAKTIYQEKSTNSLKGENEWIHPDMVGFSLPMTNWSDRVVTMCGHYHLPKVIIYSYELKKEITMSSLREDYFQAVSNSSWANEGYLVAAKIDTNDEKLMQKMGRLCSAFGVGIILLNLHHPDESKVLFEAHMKEAIDGDTVNHLHDINQDFKDFLKTVEDSLKINNIVRYNLDDLKSKKELEEILKKSDDGNEAIVSNDNEDSFAFRKLEINESPKGKKPKSISIHDQFQEVKSWKELYIFVCETFSEYDIEKFKEFCKMNKGFKRVYFSKNENDLTVPYYIEKLGMYMEVNWSAENVIKNTKALIKHFDFVGKIEIMIEN